MNEHACRCNWSDQRRIIKTIKDGAITPGMIRLRTGFGCEHCTVELQQLIRETIIFKNRNKSVA